jgi:DNA-binding XRE family transcriptional regulator
MTTETTDTISPLGSDASAGRARRKGRSEEYRQQAELTAPYEQLAGLLIKHRMENELSQKQLAKIVGTSATAISGSRAASTLRR